MVRLACQLAVLVLIVSPEARAMLRPYLGELLNPVQEWSVRSRVSEVARHLEAEHAAGRPIPVYSGLGQFIRRAYGDDAVADPWGTPLYLTRDPLGLRVASAGTDRRRDTEDDIFSPPIDQRHEGASAAAFFPVAPAWTSR